MLPLSQQAQELLEARYLLPGEDWTGLCDRVADYLSDTDEECQQFFDVMSERKFLPNTPCLVNAGRVKGKQGQLSACFVLPVEDSIPGIFGTLADVATISKTGGGVGLDFSKLRPEGSIIASSGGMSSGPVSFLRIYNTAIGELKQGGFRRGAALGLLGVDHPDIPKWVTCKDQDGNISNFNLSVSITDKFMQNKDGGELETHLAANKLWDLICQQAWKNGEPGLVFIDTIQRAKYSGASNIHCVNACAELPAEDYEACCLGSIDVSKFADEHSIDEAAMAHAIETGVDILNKIIDKSAYPLERTTKIVQKNRKIGLGVMGFADLLIKRGIIYGSDESLHLADKLMGFIQATAKAHSDKIGYRNTTLTAIAPTGSLSIIAGCSSGIEPNFAKIIHRQPVGLPAQEVIHPLANNPHFVTADQVAPDRHIMMQAAFQAHVDNGVSKTINLLANATVDDVKAAFQLAWESGCKGITVYRDGSRAGQVLTRPEDKQPVPKIEQERPFSLTGRTYKIRIELGDEKFENVYITVNQSNLVPYEIFVNGNIRDISQVVAQYIDTMTRLLSLSMRAGVPVNKIIEQLEKVPRGHLYSLPHKISDVLKEFLPESERAKCPECGMSITFSEGCRVCLSCGWGKCG